jgi:phosphatidylserine/phosphatidylglycerophosphate/cardiolipin synthase-like enzyme
MGSFAFCKKLFPAVFFLALLSISGFSLAGEEGQHISRQHFGCSAVLLTNKNYFPALIKSIDNAQDEIFMSIFSFKTDMHKNSYPDRVLLHLSRAVQRGVKVKVILENSGGRDQKIDEQNHRTKKNLEEKGVKVYLDSPQRTTHTKLIVIDQRLIILGSHNLTSSALKYNNEISVSLEDPALAKIARDYMLDIIKEAK